MSKYFGVNDYQDESILEDGSLNYELVSHSLIAFMSDKGGGPNLMRKCYRELERIMHANKDMLGF